MTKTDEQRIDTRARLAACSMVAVATVLRLINIADPATLNLHIQRQLVGVMIARNYLEGHGTLVRGLIDVSQWPNPTPWSLGLEFPFLPLAAAGLGRVFGFQPWYGNVIAVLASGGAALALWSLAERLLPRPWTRFAALGVFLYAPEAYKYSRTFQPESLQLLLSVIAVHATIRWTDEELTGDVRLARRWLLATTAAVTLLLLNKGTWVFVVLGLVGIVLMRVGWRRLLKVDVILCAVAAIVPSAIYYPLAAQAADAAQAAFTGPQMLRGVLLNWFDAGFWAVAYGWLSAWFFVPGLLALAVGAAGVALDRDEPGRWLLAWTGSALVYLVAIGPVILAPHSYYFLPVWAPGCLLIGRGLGLADRLPAVRRATSWRGVAIVAAVLAIVAAAGSFWMLRGYYTETRAEMKLYADAGDMIARASAPGDLVVFRSEDWGISLYAAYVSHRRGWSIESDQSPAEFLRTLADARARGARFVFITTFATGERYLDRPTELAATRAQLATVRAQYAEVGGTPEGVLFDLAAPLTR